MSKQKSHKIFKIGKLLLEVGCAVLVGRRRVNRLAIIAIKTSVYYVCDSGCLVNQPW